MNWFKKFLGIQTLEEKANEYISLEKESEIIKGDVQEAANEHLFMTKRTNLAYESKEISDEIRDRVLSKQQEFLKGHIDRIKDLKQRKDNVEKRIEELRKDKRINEAIEKVKKREGFNEIKKAYKGKTVSRELFDSICKAESGKVHYADVIVYNEIGEILFLQRNSDSDFEPNKWGLPGGHVDFGESSLEAAPRELKEETGLEPEDLEKVGTYEDSKVKICYYQAYIMKPSKYIDILLDESEHCDAKWMTLKQARELDLIVNLKENLLKIISPIHYNITVIKKAVDEGILPKETLSNIIEKARRGVYKDNPDNRKKGIVGMQYGTMKPEKKELDAAEKHELARKNIHTAIDEIATDLGIEFGKSDSFTGYSFYAKVKGETYRIADHGVSEKWAKVYGYPKHSLAFDGTETKEQVREKVDKFKEYIKEDLKKEDKYREDRLYKTVKIFESTSDIKEGKYNLWDSREKKEIKAEIKEVGEEKSKVTFDGREVEIPNKFILNWEEKKESTHKVLETPTHYVKKSEETSKAIGMIIEGLNEGLLDYDKIEKAHKYIRREGVKGNYKYIYAEPQGTDGGYVEENNINTKNIKDHAKRIIEGTEHLERLSPDEESGRRKGGSRNVEASIITGGKKGTMQDDKGAELDKGEQIDLLTKYAKEEDIWYDNLDEYLGEENHLDGGSENEVYSGENEGEVYKINRLPGETTPLDLFDKISIHNYLFPDVSYTVLGFGRDKEGRFAVLKSQPFIKATELTKEEDIKRDMAERGFDYEGFMSYGGRGYSISDLKEENVITNNGKLYYIDPFISKNNIKKSDELFYNEEENIFEKHLSEDIEKGKKANIGEVREWSGKKMKKVSKDRWEEINKGVKGFDDKEKLTNFTKKIKDYAEQVIKGESVIERLSPKEEQGRMLAGRRTIETTIFISESKRASGEGEELGRRQQEKLIEGFAKETGCWVDSYQKEFEKYEYLDKGGESKVYFSEEDRSVYKVNHFPFEGDFMGFLDRICIHNTLFPETKYEVIGFTRTKDELGEDFVAFIIKQPFIETENSPVTERDVFEDLSSRGFIERDGQMMNEDYVIGDTHPGNVLKKSGVLMYIDPIIEINTPGAGYGGSRVLGEINLGDEEANKAFSIIQKAFNEGIIDEDALLKAQRVYMDNAENRKLKRVGKPYGSAGQEEHKTDKPSKEGDESGASSKGVEEHAREASQEALESATKSGNEELRIAAKKELDRREKEETPKEEDEKEEGGFKIKEGTLQEKFKKDLGSEGFYQDAVNNIPWLYAEEYDIKDFDVKDLDVSKVKPSQEGEDYINASSEYTAKMYKEYLSGEAEVDDLRKEDFYPILVDSETMEILDGNHRHAAHTMNGIGKIKAILLKPKSKDSQKKESKDKDEDK